MAVDSAVLLAYTTNGCRVSLVSNQGPHVMAAMLRRVHQLQVLDSVVGWVAVYVVDVLVRCKRATQVFLHHMAMFVHQAFSLYRPLNVAADVDRLAAPPSRSQWPSLASCSTRVRAISTAPSCDSGWRSEETFLTTFACQFDALDVSHIGALERAIGALSAVANARRGNVKRSSTVLTNAVYWHRNPLLFTPWRI